MSTLPLALSFSSKFTELGALVAFVALFGIAVLSLLVFSQAREIKRLREWAGRAPERAAEVEQRVTAQAAARLSPPREGSIKRGKQRNNVDGLILGGYLPRPRCRRRLVRPQLVRAPPPRPRAPPPRASPAGPLRPRLQRHPRGHRQQDPRFRFLRRRMPSGCR